MSIVHPDTPLVQTDGAGPIDDHAELIGSVADHARRAHRAGLCVIPPAEDGSKAPSPADRSRATAWARYQRKRSTEAEMKRWYPDRQGWGIVCGNISGNLEALDFDDGPTFDRYVEAAERLGLGELVGRVKAGFTTRTPSGGVHLLWRCARVQGNQKLAQRPDPDRPGKVLTLIETRGEGGYVVEAPSGGAVHPSGRPYEMIAGSVETIAKVSPDERVLLLELARSFDEMPDPTEPTDDGKGDGGRRPGKAVREPKGRNEDGSKRPGDDFNERASWDEILAGWSKVYTTTTGKTFWRRPGKEGPGGSATTGFGDADLLYVFSTSTQLQAECWYTKFAAYTLLNHGGTEKAHFGEAAKDLYRRGYGTHMATEPDPSDPTGLAMRLVERQNPRPKVEVTIGGRKVEVGGEGRKAGANGRHRHHHANGDGKAGATADQGADQGERKAEADGKAEAGAEPKGLRIDARKASSYRPRPVKFLAKPRLPRGMVVLVAGAGGEGKSTFVEAVAADLTMNRPTMGSSEPYGEPVDVLMIACEDGREDAMIPRLIAGGADLDRIEIIEGLKTEKGERIPFDITYLCYLRQHIIDGNAAGRNYKLVIIDPITTYVGRAKVDDHRDAALKPALEGLSHIAQELDVTFVCLAHLNKSGNTKSAIHRVMGGGAYVTSSRLTYIYATDPDDDERRILASPKANIPGGKPPSLAVRIGQIPEAEALAILGPYVSHLGDEDRAELAGQLYRISYDGESSKTADEVLDTGGGGRGGTKSRKEMAIEFLTAKLGDGRAVPSEDLIKEAKKHAPPISRDALFEAKKDLGIRALKMTREDGSGWYWQWADSPHRDHWTTTANDFD